MNKTISEIFSFGAVVNDTVMFSNRVFKFVLETIKKILWSIMLADDIHHICLEQKATLTRVKEYSLNSCREVISINGNMEAIRCQNSFVRILMCFFLLLWTVDVEAVVRLPAVISDNMVLQRGQPVPIWGWADKGEVVTVTLSGQILSACSNDEGCWKVVLAKLDIGQPLKMIIKGSYGNTITLKNILVGDVWLCSGQSNMGLSVFECNNAREEIASANYPEIRLLRVPFRVTSEPQQNFKAQWVKCLPKNIEKFSAAAYYFGRELHQNLKVPIGLIDCSVGASSCEAWIKRSVLEANPQYNQMLQGWDKQIDTFDLQKVNEAELQYRLFMKKVNLATARGKEPPVAPFKTTDLFNLMFPVRRCPSYCYNGMLLPLIPFAIHGVIWYQGETNVPRAFQYRELFPLMIRSWRKDWDQGDFPFIFVQLANNHEVKEVPGQSNLAELREAQTLTLRTPNTGMIVTIDIGDAKTQHPTNKQDVGKRLSLWALANLHGKNIVYSGPMYKSMEKKGTQIFLYFDHQGTGLMTKGGELLKGFTIAGADQKFVWAEAHIDGDVIIVSSPDVPEPVAVRYAWADNPVCNLYNREGLPATPFRTDSWKGLTEHNDK
jgi:sialate O-acetylesterase